MSNFDQAFVDLLGYEGGYSNHPDDPGGGAIGGLVAQKGV